MRNWNFSILLLLYGYVQCLTSLDNPIAESGIFMEDLCKDVKNYRKLPNPFDKHGFFECFNGESIEKVCPGKKNFDPTLKRCVSMSDKKAPTPPKASLKDKLKKRQPSPLAAKFRLVPKAMLRDTKKTTKKPRRFVREISSSDPQEELTNCVGQKNWIQLPHPDTCEKYFLCVNEVTYPRECPVGEWFDELRQKCVPPRESRCVHKAPEIFCDGVPNFHLLESPNYCEDYYMCVNDIPYFYRCDNNLWFDQKNQRCDKPDIVDCIIYNPPNPPEDLCENVPNFKYIGSPFNCAHYYQCIFQKPYFKKCPEGNWFDLEKQSCRDKHEVECTNIVESSK